MKNIEDLVQFLFNYYDNCEYIAMNIDNNQYYNNGVLFDEWEGEYILIGFNKKPIIANIDGYLKYVDSSHNESCKFENEEALFFFEFDGKEFNVTNKPVFKNKNNEYEWGYLWKKSVGVISYKGTDIT